MPTLEIVFRAERQPDGSYRGTVVVPAVPGAAVPPQLQAMLPPGQTPTGVTAVGPRAPSKAAAVAKAAALADKALSNPLVQAVLPPQAKLALSAAKKAFKVGKSLRKFF